ncbi:MAG: DUF58 domain-containing protein [Anaerolineae bacterium]|nr:DUF58 domain-containing protein [Anaerolineae bacterium]
MLSFWPRLSARTRRALVGDTEARIGLRLRLPAVWLAALALAALLLPDRIWTTLLIGVVGLLLVGFLWARALARGLSAERKLRFGWVSVGDRLEEEFALVNRSGVPALWVEIRDESNVPGYQVGAARAVAAADSARWRAASVCTRRGQFHLGPWTIETGDPFGLFRVSRRYEAREEIIIHPPIHAALPIPLPPGRSDGRARTRERNWQAASNAAGVREYHTSDPLHWIHWPTTARRDSLYVRQFERDAAGDIWLVLDAQAAAQLGEGPQGTEEHAVLLAAALAARALDETRGVGLIAFGREPRVVPPALGAGQQWNILRALALLRADGDTDLRRTLQELGDIARRGSAAIIITPTAEANWLPQLAHLARRGLESHVLLLDRPSFGGEGNSEALRAAIALLGFRGHVVRRGELGRPLVEDERHGYWEFMVTGTGRAVAVRRPLDH